ncbi:MAG: DUF1573 domain-containing protein [Bacteroidales bacterium]|nr:DUF1573 domain-containing protein [Bacteroidales bacterium]
MKIKGILFFVIALILLASCTGEGRGKNDRGGISLKDGETGEISFREYEHDFGKISEGEKVAHIFEFENKGPGNLVLKSASTSCGCTVTKYDKKPIAPGQTGSLEVVFDSGGRTGMQTKTVSVHSNSKTEVVILKITAEVLEK